MRRALVNPAEAGSHERQAESDARRTTRTWDSDFSRIARLESDFSRIARFESG